MSSTTEVQQLQSFCRHSCCRFVVQRTSGHRLTAESDICCPRRGDSHLPGRQATARTATGETCRHASLNLTRSLMGSQWSSRSTGVMWSQRRVPVISRAVAFCTDCNLRSGRWDSTAIGKNVCMLSSHVALLGHLALCRRFCCSPCLAER